MIETITEQPKKTIDNVFGGTQIRWQISNGMYHRIDGPAFISCQADGTANIKEWWYNGDPVWFNDWCEVSTWTDEEIVMYKLGHEVD